MKIADLKNKKIAILGFGIENQALLKYLILKKIPCQITICDKREKEHLKNNNLLFTSKNNILINYNLGVGYDKNLSQYDIIFRVAGYPLFSKELKKVNQKKTIITDPIKLFFDICPSKNIVGVTGTNGKGTTSSIIYNIFKTARKTAFIGGNIGIAMFSFLDKIKKNDWVILELSSFQLEDLTVSPHIAVITNITPDHLAPANLANPNYHKNFSAYQKAKENIFLHQTKNDYFIVNKKLLNIVKNKKIKSRVIEYDKVALKSNLVGTHNMENIAAALEVAKIAKISKAVCQKAIANFKGLENRLEYIRNINGVRYYNDSYSATPDSTITALNSFDCPIILFLGGADKGSDFTEMMETIKKKNIKHIFLFDWKKKPKQSTKKLLLGLQNIKFPKQKITKFENFEQTVKDASQLSVKDDLILLSPGCGSFGMFNNFKERGEQFKSFVSKL